MSIFELWNRLIWWIEKHNLVICYSCKNVFFIIDTYPERTTFGLNVNLCHRCHSDLFTSYGEK